MIMLGIDAHKRTHTVVAIDHVGRQLDVKTTSATTTADHLAIVRWADQFGSERCCAVEDCRHLSRRLERDMLAAGERIVRVPPKLMAHSRDSARTYGKSDPIDALAVARAALREPGLPTAHLDDSARELDCWWTIEKTRSGSGPGTSTGFAGICTRSTRRGSQSSERSPRSSISTSPQADSLASTA
jgi:hypothetical protein